MVIKESIQFTEDDLTQLLVKRFAEYADRESTVEDEIHDFIENQTMFEHNVLDLMVKAPKAVYEAAFAYEESNGVSIPAGVTSFVSHAIQYIIETHYSEFVQAFNNDYDI